MAIELHYTPTIVVDATQFIQTQNSLDINIYIFTFKLLVICHRRNSSMQVGKTLADLIDDPVNFTVYCITELKDVIYEAKCNTRRENLNTSIFVQKMNHAICIPVTVTRDNE